MAAKTITCQWCRTPVVIAAKVTYKNKAYHVKCAQEIADRDEFLDYVCKQQFLLSPGPTIYRQRKNFIEKYGYTDKEMLQAARYIHEVVNKGKNREQWNETIGLIPHVMEDAKEHWAKEEARKTIIADYFAALPEQKEIVIHAPAPTEKPKRFIDPLSILKEEEE